jgi:nucleoside phosphorylase
MRLLQDFKSVQEFIMVGIAGGVPGLKAGQKDVRLGDVVVTDETGIAQSHMGKVTDAGLQHRPPPRAASQAWSALSKGLLAAQVPLQDYWGYVDEICAATDCERPTRDVLRDGVGDEATVATRRIKDRRRAKGRPFAHNGRIGSGNAVIKSAEERERLRDELDIIAIEMEGSGIAEAAWQSERVGFRRMRPGASRLGSRHLPNYTRRCGAGSSEVRGAERAPQQASKAPPKIPVAGPLSTNEQPRRRLTVAGVVKCRAALGLGRGSA